MERSAVIDEAVERFKAASDAESQWRDQCLEDLRFSIGEIDGKSTQWRPEDIAARLAEKRPAMTINRQQQFIRQVTNELRQNNPSIRVNPVDDGADIETAEVYQGLIRHIEVASFADIARAVASHHMATHGIGYTRIRTEYCVDLRADKNGNPLQPDTDIFDQDIRIDRILNPFSVYFDSAAEEPDKSDAQYAFIVSTVTLAQHKRLWPKAQVSGLNELIGIGDEASDWFRGEAGIRIAEYFARESRWFRVVLADVNGDSVIGFADEIEKKLLGRRLTQHEIIIERRVELPKIIHRKINGTEVLEESIWPGRYIPIVPYIGEEYIIEGRKHISGMVRSTRPAQQMYNFWISALSEMIALMPKSPWVIAEGQDEGYQALWESANREAHSVLVYKPTTVDGQVVPAPQRGWSEPPIQAITMAILQADRDMKATFGIYEAGLGQKGPQESGRAIEARKVEGDVSNYHLIDNVSRGRRYEGRQLLDLIPKVYDRERVVQIIGVDDTPETVTVNSAAPIQHKGIERIYDLKAGRYDVAISVGPGYQTKRQQAADQLTGLITASPEIMTYAPDLVIKATDIPYAQDIAKRAKKTLPPHLVDEGEQQIPPEVQAKMQQDAEAIEFLKKQVMEVNAKLEDKQAEIESKERIADENNQTKILIEQMKIESEEKIARLEADMQRIAKMIESRHADEDREFQRESSDKERAVKLETASAKAKNGGGEK